MRLNDTSRILLIDSTSASWPARHADEQAVPACENGREDLLDNIGLPDDDTPQLLEHLRTGLTETVPGIR